MTTLGTDEWAGMDLSVRRGNDHDPSWFAGLKGLSDHYDMIIVGAGISGCVFAERGSRELGLRSLIIDKRDHIGGNCYDFINKHGFRVSQYGVHLFHTKFDRVWEYVNRFSEWMPYEHRVKGKVDVGEGYKIVPIPPSQETVNTLFHANVHTEEEMEAWLNARREVNENPANGEESALTRSGKELYEAIFKHYTKKQWDKWPEELDASVLARIPVRTNTDDRYFSDQHQALPKDGYTRIFENMIMSDPNITVRLNVDFFAERDNLPKCGLTVFTGPIDAYYASQGLPKLEYQLLAILRGVPRAGREPRGSSSWVLSALPSAQLPGPEVDFTHIVEVQAQAQSARGGARVQGHGHLQGVQLRPR